MSSTPSTLNNLTAAERQAFSQLFAMADPTHSGVLSGEAAVPFFEGFKLPTMTLGQIWSIADSQNQGFLTPATFGVALRLIARAQRGESVNEAAVHTPGAPPVYEGVSYGAAPASSAAAPPTPSASLISEEDKARFTRIFAMVGPTQGILSNEQAKDVFLKSKLPYEKLGAIWNLADTKQRGMLDLPDFIIGMHYIQGTMNGTITSLPSTLPPGMYEAAAAGTSHGMASSQPPATPQRGMSQDSMQTSTVPSTPAVAPAQAPISSASRSSTTGPTAGSMPASSSQTTSAPLPPTPSSTGSSWAITPASKARYDGFFDQLDTQRAGYVDGGVVVPFFLQSGLDETTLAHVWDLADLTQDGTLTRDEFAIAMQLIDDKMAGKPVPEQLPASLLPPSARSMPMPAAAAAAAPATQPPPPPPAQAKTQTQRELFSLLDTDVPSGSLSPSEGLSTFATSPAMPASAPTPSMQPMQPTSTVRAVPSQAAGAEGVAAVAASVGVGAAVDAALTREKETAVRDPFVPEDDDVSTAQVDEAKAALAATQTARDDVSARRSKTEASHTSNATTLAELEAQLTRAKKEHEAEEVAVAELERKVQAQEEEIQTLRQSVIREESELSALRTQRDEQEQKLLQDRETGHGLKRQLGELQAESQKLRAELERLAGEAKRQAALNAAAHQELSTAQDEHTSLRSSVTSAASVPKSGTSTPSSARRLNPFEMMGSAPSGAATPTLSRGTPAAFDTQYGAAAFATQAPPPPPPVAKDTLAAPAVMSEPRENTTGQQGGWSVHDALTQQPQVVALPTRESVSQAVGVPESDDDEEEGPEEAEAAMYRTPEAPSIAHMPTTSHATIPPMPPPGHGVSGTDLPRDASAMSLPGGFPGEQDVEGPNGETRVVNGQALTYDAPATQPGMPTHVVDAPVPTSPSAEVPSQPLTAASMPAVAPSSASTIVVPPSSAPATPSTVAGGTATSNDFDAAFSRMGVANVVHRHGTPSSVASQRGNVPPAVRSPLSNEVPTSSVPPYLQSSTIVPPPPPGGNVHTGATTTVSKPSGIEQQETPTQQQFEDNFEPASPNAASNVGAALASARAPSPPLPGDIGPVRQLCQMGFSRSQVIRALERSNYRTERALERLLADQGDRA